MQVRHPKLAHTDEDPTSKQSMNRSTAHGERSTAPTRSPGPLDTSTRELALDPVRTEILGGQALGLAPVHVTAVVAAAEMRHTGHTVATPETLWVPRDGQDIVTSECHSATRSLCGPWSRQRPSSCMAGMSATDRYAVVGA